MIEFKLEKLESTREVKYTIIPSTKGIIPKELQGGRMLEEKSPSPPRDALPSVIAKNHGLM